MSKKMCPKWLKPYMVNMAGVCVNRAMAPERCPKNTNSKCEIITKKPRVVRVKAWANMDRFGRLCGADYYSHKDFNIPCTILIDKKYLRRKP